MTEPDFELIERIQKGEKPAFRELVTRHMEHAVQIAYNAVGNYEDAREVAQDAFVKVYRGLGKFDKRAKFTTWFYRILMNTAKDFHRRKKWVKFVNWGKTEDKDRFIDNIREGRPGTAGTIMNEELRGKMLSAVEQLPDKQRIIFKLRYLEGYSLAEIEDITGLSNGTVKASLHFAGQKFKKMMTEYVKAGG